MLQPLRMALLLLSSAVPWCAPADADAQTKGRDFDFYVLSLSWSPTFCTTSDGAKNRYQCGTSRQYGLIVHGLWPQYEQGYPQSCPSSQPRRVPSSLGQKYFDIMPSMGLIGHQWRKHGTCSGLSQEDYFAVTRAAFERIRVPDSLREAKKPIDLRVAAIEMQFTQANSGLSNRGLAITCEDGKLEEIRICLTRDLDFRDCPNIDYQGCPLKSVFVPPPQ
ncbi:MAG: ribonuclease [Rhizobium sp.]